MANIFNQVPVGCLRRWTPAAIECYKSGCNCATCKIIKGLETVTPKNCNMKAAVLWLVKKYGRPSITNKREEDT